MKERKRVTVTRMCLLLLKYPSDSELSRFLVLRVKCVACEVCCV